MSQYHIAIHTKLHRARFNASDTTHKYLNNIVWYSFPIVYPNWFVEHKNVEKQYQSLRARKKRAYKYVFSLCAKTDGLNLYFVTLTFSDKYIDNEYNTLKKYAELFLKKNCKDYFCSPDWGKKGQRLHFHAICIISSDLSSYTYKSKEHLCFSDPWGYGFASIKKIPYDPLEVKKTLYYSLKSLNYSMKNLQSNQFKPFHPRKASYRVLNSDLELFDSCS